MSLIAQEITAHGGWLGFERFMAMALYMPGLGYYAHGSRKFGHLPGSGSDFVTAPELSPLFAKALAVQLRQALSVTRTQAIWEFGAGSGALAAGLLEALGEQVQQYTIVDLSGSLRARQAERLRPWAGKVSWVDGLPAEIRGVVIGNEVLDAMPVSLLQRSGGLWHERGVGLFDGQLTWRDQLTALRPPIDIVGEHDYLTEIHPQADAFVRTLADRLVQGAAFLLDYGFPESEYYHPQRHMGTLMCHQAHLADGDPLVAVGDKDITAHVNFSGVAFAGQDAGLNVLGYTTQARFLLNCGMTDLLGQASLAEQVSAQKLWMEHEMGELFKVIAFGAGDAWEPLGFAAGDRSHRL
ncbi:MAG: SAM-dependent methyltransferase [Betaproteobacteria bacterium]|nr:SAM-dependent methyltransferase [Betaproteobacteria bacterium]MBP6646152.1 SAM-dependent methyltransferase [Burkholderiaceae bacterium]